ncbi:MAG: zinc ribbon domain-containing protein, partial [Anaerolineae bacterium]|nr:zinc ribbon domain-containing protein [Anaerolineae bacterium]
LPPDAQALLSAGRGRVLIASSREDELSYAGRPYSAFTLALVEALCGTGVAKQDGYVRVADLALYAREMVPQRTEQRQHPILHFEHADNFVLAYYAGGDTQPKALPFAGAPRIEPHPGAWRGLDLHGQVVHGDQVNVAPVFREAADHPIVLGAGQVAQNGATAVNIGDVAGQGKVNIVIGNQAAPPSSAPEPEDEDAATVCTVCRTRLRPGAKFCPRCGAPVWPR